MARLWNRKAMSEYVTDMNESFYYIYNKRGERVARIWNRRLLPG